MSAKATSIVGYLGIIGWLIAFLAGDKEGAKQHLNQAFVPALLWTFGWIVFVIPGLFGMVFCIIGIIRAAQDNNEPLPLFGGVKIIK